MLASCDPTPATTVVATADFSTDLIASGPRPARIDPTSLVDPELLRRSRQCSNKLRREPDRLPRVRETLYGIEHRGVGFYPVRVPEHGEAKDLHNYHNHSRQSCRCKGPSRPSAKKKESGNTSRKG
jgi:hypothetical protein